MEFTEAKNEIKQLRAELAQVEEEYTGFYRIFAENEKKKRLCETRKRDIKKKIKNLENLVETENMFEEVKDVEGFVTLSQSELVAISNGMDKTDYRQYGKYPRWLDLERLVKKVIEFKKLYPGWILEEVEKRGQYDCLPPTSFYKFTYNTPHGHSMTIQ